MPLPALDTERLLIRPWSMDDLAAFHVIWGDPAVIWWGATADLDGSRDMLRSLLRRSEAAGLGLGWGAVEVATSGDVVGNVMLGPAPDPTGMIEIGWHLACAHWGNGYATEAARAPLLHAYGTLGLERVIAQIVADNTRSRAVAESLGMGHDGTAMRDGVFHDLWWAARQEPEL